MRHLPSISLAGLAAAVLAVAGCGGAGGNDPSATASSAVRRADAVCAELAQRRDAIRTLAQDAPRRAVTARAYAALAEVTVDTSAELERTVAAGAPSPELRRYLAAAHHEASVAWQVRRALAQSDLVRAKQLVEEASAAAASTRALARAAGLRVCGVRA